MARAASTSAQQRFEQSRWITAAILAFFIMVILVEVVIAPGTMIRRHLHAAPVEHDPNASIERARPSLLLNSERLRKLLNEVESSFADFQTETSRRFSVDITHLDQTRLSTAILRDSVVLNAWADIRRSLSEVADEIARGRTVLQRTTPRIDSSSAGDDDEQDVLDAINRLEDAQRSLRRLTAELQHIEFEVPIGPSTREVNH